MLMNKLTKDKKSNALWRVAAGHKQNIDEPQRIQSVSCTL